MRTPTSGLSVLFLSAMAHGQWSPGVWPISRAGLIGPEFTRADGYQNSFWMATDPLITQVVGRSERFQGSTSIGYAAWVWDQAHGTTRVGFTGPGFVRDDGAMSSSVSSLIGSGRVFGTSTTYMGSSSNGSVAYGWSAASGTVEIGLTGAAYTGSNGLTWSELHANNTVGRAAGISQKWGSGNWGIEAWTWTPAAGAVRAGLIDSEHVRADGYREEYPLGVNDSGRVIGWSFRFSGSADRGTSAWYGDPGASTATEIGIFDADHTASDGTRHNQPIAGELGGVAPSGSVLGMAYRYLGTDSTGQDTWIWTPQTGAMLIGLVDQEHTSSTGWRWVSGLRQNSAGWAFGTSSRYAGSTSLGTSAWVYVPGASSIEIGLLDAEHTRADGARLSSPLAISETGVVVGVSNRYSDSTGIGQTAWRWTTGSGVTAIGLYDSVHTRNDGFQYSSASLVNSAGIVVGTSRRYSGPGQVGASAWFYDPSAGTSVPLVFSVSPSGIANTSPLILTESGWVLGTYVFYTGEAGEQRAFIWSRSSGLTDLGAFVSGGLSSHGWQALSRVSSAREFSLVVGAGQPAGTTGTAVFVMNVSPGCYANCDNGTAAPVLNVNDFVCFQTRFAAGDPYANCDGSTLPPILNVNDFVCFQSRFVLGCP